MPFTSDTTSADFWKVASSGRLVRIGLHQKTFFTRQRNQHTAQQRRDDNHFCFCLHILNVFHLSIFKKLRLIQWCNSVKKDKYHYPNRSVLHCRPVCRFQDQDRCIW